MTSVYKVKTWHDVSLNMFSDLLLDASYRRERVASIFPEDDRNISSAKGLERFADWVNNNGQNTVVIQLLTPLKCALESRNESVMAGADDAIFKFHFHDNNESFEDFCERLYGILRHDINKWIGKDVI